MQTAKPRFRVHLTRGQSLDAMAVDRIPEWAGFYLITTARRRVEYDEAANLGRSVVEGVRRRRIHERRIAEIVELDR